MTSERLTFATLGLMYVGKKYCGTLDGKRVTLRVIDVTFGSDVVIRRRSYGESVVQQSKFLSFMETAKEIT
jgi:hypothetical protein